VKGYVLAFAGEGKGETIFQKLRIRFAEAVKRDQAEGLLFSGGLDSSLVAAQAKKGFLRQSELCLYGEKGR